MNDKPKRKRSERTNPLYGKRRFALLAVLYAVFLLPCFAKLGYLLVALIAVSLGLGVLAIGSYLINLLGKLEHSLLTKTVIFVITAASASLAGILIVIPPLVPLMEYMFVLTLSASLVLFFAFMLLSFAFTLELQIQIIALMNSFRHRAIETERQKNDNSSRLSDELEEPDIPLELLVEAESAEQAQR